MIHLFFPHSTGSITDGLSDDLDKAMSQAELWCEDNKTEATIFVCEYRAVARIVRQPDGTYVAHKVTP